MKLIKQDDVFIHELSADEVERLELGVLLPLGNNHFIRSKEYVEKMINDKLEYNEMCEDVEVHKNMKDKNYIINTMCRNCGKKRGYKIQYGLGLEFCQCLNCGTFRLEYLDEPIKEKADIKSANTVISKG